MASSQNSSALLVIDQQIDFEPGGALAVEGGDEIAQPIAELMSSYHHVILTQDSHPLGHISFASSYEGKDPFELLTLEEANSVKIKSSFSRETLKTYLTKVANNTQVLWPDHCIIGSAGWQFDKKIPVEKADLILKKGQHLECDSYSAFFENDGTSTGLTSNLREKGIKRLSIVGLAGDYCVYWSAKDAIREGFKVEFDESLTRFVNFPEKSKENALKDLKNLGVEFKALR